MKYLFLTILVSFSLNVVAQDIYRWTDSNGVIHYSYKAPENVAAHKVKKMDMNKQSQFVNSSVAKTEDARSKQEKELDRISKQNCDIAKKNIQVLSTFANIQQKNSEGDLQTLTKEDKSKQLSLANKQAALFCKEKAEVSQ